MDVVAVMYLSCGPWYEHGDVEGEYPPAAVRVYKVFEDGSLALHNSGTFIAVMFGNEYYGYRHESPISPSGADYPLGTGAPRVWFGWSPSLGFQQAMYATEADSYADVNPVALPTIDAHPELDMHCANFMGGESSTYVHFEPVRGGAPASEFWTDFIDTYEEV